MATGFEGNTFEAMDKALKNINQEAFAWATDEKLGGYAGFVIRTAQDVSILLDKYPIDLSLFFNNPDHNDILIAKFGYEHLRNAYLDEPRTCSCGKSCASGTDCGCMEPIKSMHKDVINAYVKYLNVYKLKYDGMVHWLKEDIDAWLAPFKENITKESNADYVKWDQYFAKRRDEIKEQYNPGAGASKDEKLAYYEVLAEDEKRIKELKKFITTTLEKDLKRLDDHYDPVKWLESGGLPRITDPLSPLPDFPGACGCQDIISLPKITWDFNEAVYRVWASPIILDLDGDGVEAYGSNKSNVMFDFDGDGRKNQTGWVGKDDGLLVFDRNGDGVINDGSELFGDNTVKYDGSGKAKDGFEALAQEDTNGDGVIDASDANWGNLKVWRDLNQDGITDAGELFTLDELGIKNINLAHNLNQENQANGNYLYGTGSYTTNDGQTHDLADVFFEQKEIISEFTDEIEVPNEIQENLPNVAGTGAVRNLWEACAQSPELKDLVTRYAAAGTRAEQMALLDELLLTWAKTGGMPTFEERVAGQYQVNSNMKGMLAQHLSYQFTEAECWRKFSILEAFNGAFIHQLPENLAPGQTLPSDISITDNKNVYIKFYGDQLAFYLQCYNNLADYVHTTIISQTILNPVIDLIGLNIDDNSFDITFDFSQVNAYFQTRLAENQAGGLAELVDFTRFLEISSFQSSWNGYQLVQQAINNWQGTAGELADLAKALRITVGGQAGQSLTGTYLSDVIFGGNGNDKINGNFFGDDRIYGGGGDDTITGGDGNDILDGGSGNDILYGEAGSDKLYGGEGDDKLYGGAGNDILDGGAGNDWLEGGAGNDVYIFGRGYGHDTINTYDTASDKYDLLRLKGLTLGDVTFSVSFQANGDFQNLVIKINDTGETVTITGGLSDARGNPYWLQGIEFADGSILNMADVLAHGLYANENDNRVYALKNVDSKLHGSGKNSILYGNIGNDQLYGGEGDDKLYGGAGNDILDGGAGNDYLEGGAGNDTYIFGRGCGHDTINTYDAASGKYDLLRLKGLTLGDVTFSVSFQPGGNYQNLVIKINDTGETVTISRGLSDTSGNPYWLQGIEFADGSILNMADVLAHGLYANESDNLVYALKNVDSKLHGSGKNSILYGEAGNDQLYGGEGDDKLYGGAGNDILDGGAGNDYLEGGVGNDVYIFGRGYGHDTINTYDAASGKYDLLRLKGLTLGDVTFTASFQASGAYQNLVIKINDTGETMTIASGLSDTRGNPYWLQGIEFADGSILNMADVLAHGLYANESDNRVYALKNVDSKLHGSGKNSILYGEAGNDTLYGGAGNDKLYGGAGNDILDGGAGNDYLDGGAGNDTYIFRPGGGQDTINNYGGGDDLLKFENINPVDLWFGRSGNNLTIGLVGSTDKVTVDNWYGGDYKIDTIQAGNDIITETQVAQMVQAMAAIGAPGGAGGGWTEDQKDALAPVLTTYWKTAA